MKQSSDYEVSQERKLQSGKEKKIHRFIGWFHLFCKFFRKKRNFLNKIKGSKKSP